MDNPATVPPPAQLRIVGMKAQRPAIPATSALGLGEGFLFGLPGGALLAIPVAIRVPGTLSQMLLVWLAALGLYGVLLGLTTGLLRGARPLPRLSPSVPLGFAIAFGPLCLLTATLHSSTHHRPLGAATFALLAAGIGLLAIVVGLRIWISMNSARRPRRLLGIALLGFGLLFSAATAFRPLLALLGALSQNPLVGSVVIDGALGVSLVLAGGFARFPRKVEFAARSAGPLALLVCLLTLAVALRTDSTSELLGQGSALWAWLR